MSLNEIKELSPDISICPQLQVHDLAAVAARGFKSVINARPDNEGPDQPLSDDIKAAAEAAGLRYEYLPVIPNLIKESDVRAFAKHLDELPKPILGFCRSGMRCSMLWSQANELQKNQ